MIEEQVRILEQKVNDLIANLDGYFLVDLFIKPTNNIKIFIDADQGASIDHLTKVNRALYKDIEENGFFPNGDFSLEVSSPGLDEPLKLHRQYLKNKGREVEVLLRNGIKYEGKLMEATESEIILQEQKGHKKKQEFIEHKIALGDVKHTKVQVKI